MLIWSCFVFWIGRLDCTHFWQIHTFHKAINPLRTYIYAIFTGKAIFYLVSSEAFFWSCIKLGNTTSNPTVFKLSFRGLVMKKFVICASVDTKNTAKRCNSVFWWQQLYGIQSLPEFGVNIAMAFFSIRFSSSSWALRFWSSFICLAVKTVSSSIFTSEYCFIQLDKALWEIPYSLCISEYVFPEWYRLTIVCLYSWVYFGFLKTFFIPPFSVFYFIILVHFFIIYPIWFV